MLLIYTQSNINTPVFSQALQPLSLFLNECELSLRFPPSPSLFLAPILPSVTHLLNNTAPNALFIINQSINIEQTLHESALFRLLKKADQEVNSRGLVHLVQIGQHAVTANTRTRITDNAAHLKQHIYLNRSSPPAGEKGSLQLSVIKWFVNLSCTWHFYGVFYNISPGAAYILNAEDFNPMGLM